MTEVVLGHVIATGTSGATGSRNVNSAPPPGAAALSGQTSPEDAIRQANGEITKALATF